MASSVAGYPGGLKDPNGFGDRIIETARSITERAAVGRRVEVEPARQRGREFRQVESAFEALQRMPPVQRGQPRAHQYVRHRVGSARLAEYGGQALQQLIPGQVFVADQCRAVVATLQSA